MFRAAHPKDLPGLISLAAQAAPDLAYPRQRLGGGGGHVWVARALLSSWIPRRGVTHALILTQGSHVGGMAVLRGQKRLSTWEIDKLLIGPGSSEDTCTELLARLDAMVVQARGVRVFLRLAEGSPASNAACEAGYRPYMTEDLYRAPEGGPASRFPVPDAPPGMEVRPRRSEDDYPLFRLYTAATPVTVRAAEGLTFREWQETGNIRWQGMQRVRDTVVLAADRPVGWVRTATAPSGHTLASLLADPREPEAADAVVHVTLERAMGPGFRILVPTYSTSLADRLEEAGLGPTGTYISLVHPVGERLMEGAFMPAGV